MRQYTQSGQPQGNLWANIKQFSARGGFQNGLNPALVGKTWYVNANSVTDAAERRGPVGSDGNDGLSPLTPFATVSRAFEFVDSYDVIVIDGVVREQVTAPLGVFDVTIVGSANRPRQATDAGVATGGGATWLAPASGAVAATPLLTLRQQGWALVNIFFGPPADASAVQMKRAESATFPDASHCSFLGCAFGGGFIGIEDVGGQSNVLIDGCQFYAQTGAGGGAIKVTSQGIAIPSKWQVLNNVILPCVNGIVGAFVECVFQNNKIEKATTTTLNFASGNVGLRNMVVFNFFNIAAVDFDPAGGVTGNATDTWINYLSDALEFGIPTN